MEDHELRLPINRRHGANDQSIHQIERRQFSVDLSLHLVHIETETPLEQRMELRLQKPEQHLSQLERPDHFVKVDHFSVLFFIENFFVFIIKIIIKNELSDYFV